MQRYERGEVCVLPILLRPVDWYSTPFGKLKALPSDQRPVTQWENQDAAFTDIVQQIRIVIKDIQAKTIKRYTNSSVFSSSIYMQETTTSLEQLSSLLPKSQEETFSPGWR